MAAVSQLIQCALCCELRMTLFARFSVLHAVSFLIHPRTTRCIKNDTRWARPGIYSFVPLRSLLSQWCIQGAAMVRPPPGLTVSFLIIFAPFCKVRFTTEP